MQLVDGDLGRLAVGGRRHQHRGGAGVRDQPEVDAGGQLIGELLRRLLCRGQPARLHIGGPHGLRDVDDQHDHRAVARDPHIILRAGHGDGQQDQRADQQDRRQVAPLGGALGRDALQQLHIREPQDALLPGVLRDDVERNQGRDEEQDQKEPGVGKTGQ